MDTDYKIVARIMALCLNPVLEEQLTSYQCCYVPGKTILETVSVLRDGTAHAELTNNPICVLSLDFRHAFVRIYHHYISRILTWYGISPLFIDPIHSLYEHATASLQINGTLAGPIPILSAIIQGCPFRMALSAVSVHPFLRTLQVTGVTFGAENFCVSLCG